MQREIEALKARLYQETAENKRLKTEKPATIVKHTSAKKATQQAINNGVMNLIKNWVKFHGWAKIKFIRDHTTLQKVANMIYADLELTGQGTAGHKEDWIEAYSPVILKAYNEHRSYVQGRLKDAAEDWMNNHNGKLPTTGQIYACAYRQIHLDRPEQHEVFMWYVDAYLPRATGILGAFDEKVRYYTTISEAAPADAPNKKYIPPGTEAIAAVFFDNCRTKWEVCKVPLV
jgi:hypothetical protein